MSESVRQLSFSGGEIAPALYARTDHVKYDTGLRTLRNMICMRHGGVTGRPGTMYVGTTLNGGAQVRLIPFIFNETGNGQSYLLEFGDHYVAFYQNGGVVESAPSIPYTIVSPYDQADLATLKFAQSADIVTITHPDYLPRELQRLSATSWILTPVAFQPQIESPASVTDTGGNASLTKTYYAVACVAQSGEEGLPTISAFTLTGGADAANPVTLQFGGLLAIPGISKATSFRVYKSAGENTDFFGYIATTTFGTYIDYGVTPDFSNSPPIAFNPFIPPGSPVISKTGIISLPGQSPRYSYAITAVVGGVESSPTFLYSTDTTNPSIVNNHYYFAVNAVPNATSYRVYRNNGTGGNIYGRIYTGLTNRNIVDIGTIAPNFAINPPTINLNYNPSNVGFSQQRRCFSDTVVNPIGFWMSQTGLYSNFNTHIIPDDSDSVYGSLAGEEVNQIEHIVELKFMLMMTAGAEIYVQGNGSGVVTPSAVNASQQSQYGSSPLRPLKIGDIFLFNQSLGSFIRDFSFDFAIDGYRGNDITIFSSHLFEGYSLPDWAYQKIPDSIVWAVRSDGVLLSCTYVREQQILAWARHDFENGIVENICSIPENGNYSVYISIKREINGSTVRYIERISSRLWTDPIEATYLDCFLTYDGRNTGTTTMTLTTSGSFSQTDAAYQQQLTLTASVPYFTPSMVGNQMFIQDDEFVSSQGASGNQIRCTIQSYTSPTVVTVTPNKIVPAAFQSIATTNWSAAVDEVGGLEHLEGEEVSVWADRFVVGSPLNDQISNIYTVVSGLITLDKCYAVIYVGLPMTQDVQTLDLETAVGPTILAKRKLSGRINLYSYNSRGFFVGSENPDTNRDNTDDNPLYGLIEQMHGTQRETYDEPSQLGTRQDYVTFDTRWNYGGRVFLRNVDPVPFSILSIAPEGMDPAPNAGYKKV